jgi:hypothetical protein
MARTWVSIRVELVEGRGSAHGRDRAGTESTAMAGWRDPRGADLPPSGLEARAASVMSRVQRVATGRRTVGAMPSCPGRRLQLRPW